MFHTNSNLIEPPSRTLEEEPAFVDPPGWARGEVRGVVRSVVAIWEGEPEPAAILSERCHDPGSVPAALLEPSTPSAFFVRSRCRGGVLHIHSAGSQPQRRIQQVSQPDPRPLQPVSNEGHMLFEIRGINHDAFFFLSHRERLNG